MAKTWLSIRVDLVEGRGATWWPRPGRVLAAAKSHTFAELADAIDVAFARWDTNHLHEFALADGSRLSVPDPDWDEPDWDEPGEVLDDRRIKLSRLERGGNSPTPSTSVTTGATSARWGTVGSTRSKNSASCPPSPLRIGDGERSPTSTAGVGTPTTVSRRHHHRRPRAVPTCRPCARHGDPWAIGPRDADPGRSRHFPGQPERRRRVDRGEIDTSSGRDRYRSWDVRL